MEFGSTDAVAQLRRVAELQPEAEAWRDLGDALMTEGDVEDAGEAFRKVLELKPDDKSALTALGHLAYQTGHRDEGVALLSSAARRDHGGQPSSAEISLVGMYRALDQPEEALAAARLVAEAAPDDVLAALDVAELSLEVGKLDDAADAFAHIRDLDELPDHDVYALHGQIEVEIRREAFETALELAGEAMALDPRGRSAELAAFLESRVAGPGGEPAPSHEDVDAALGVSRAEYRRMLVDDRGLGLGPVS